MNKNKFNFPINNCPYCGGGTIKINQHIHGNGEYYVDLENGEIESSSLHDSLVYRNRGKYAVCADCNKRLFKVDEELNVIE